ncbi:MAG TPA: helix-turn-helix domain-containing protein [Bacteroidales bacterium]|nr:helix-turn-helix domain-containing protein [Bacteroidales bacterium]HPE23644.1 helix-turn-helix domain-containing protein [Bacteroidales bacterium]HPJ06279.1 helix-turn-helix domain-containing protein [Bacteroidales bacterium]HPQ64944.1 helix-turn-helix domain-containing protein [Bacteroidales bacterium]
MNQMQEYDARIISGAADLFRIHGIRAVTMDAIASHLGISKRSIYERFIDKDTLLFAVMDSIIIKQREMIDRILDSSPDVISAVFCIIRTGRDHAATMNPLIGSDLKKYHSNVLKRLKEKCENPDYEAARKILEKGVSQKIFRQDINVEIVGRAFKGILTMAGDEELFPREIFMQRDIMRNVMISFMRGISTAKGVQLIDSIENEI